ITNTSATNGNFITANNGADVFTLSHLGAVTGLSFTSGAPNGGTAAAWKLGTYVTETVALDTAHYVELDIAGTLYKVAVCS
ncbi:MAG: hypothetical protein ACTS5I_10840, partial [Rhodanobacter sp.]